MAKFFDLFPTTVYNINNETPSNYQYVTDIFFRLRVVREVLSNISAYFEYLVKDDEKPEILAEKIYNDPEAHWIILLANQIVDPQYEWPLNTRDFTNFITNKYGSVANAKTTIHHYEKVITRTESFSGIVTEWRYQIDQANTALTLGADVPYETWTSLTATQDYQTIDMGDGKTVTQIIKRDEISCYDYENQLNESRRNIKIIKPEYYSRLISEFNSITGNASAPYLRRIV